MQLLIINKRHKFTNSKRNNLIAISHRFNHKSVAYNTSHFTTVKHDHHSQNI